MDALLAKLNILPALVSSTGVTGDPKSLFGLLAVTMLVMYGLSVGRTKALVSLLSIYVAYTLTVLFPFADRISERLPDRFIPMMGIALFFLLYACVFLLISHSMKRTRLSLGEISIIQVLLISVVQIGLLASVVVSLLPDQIAAGVLGPLQVAFAGQRALWSWAAASLAILPLMKSRSRE